MQKLIIIIDGLENDEFELLDGLKEFKLKSKVNNTPIGMEVDTLNCVMTILGVDKDDIPKGRGVLEALGSSLTVDTNDLVLRGNFVKIDNDGILLGSHTSENEIYVNNDLYEIIHIGTYKYIIKIKKSKHLLSEIETKLPHQHIGDNITNIISTSTDNTLNNIFKEIYNKYSIICWSPSIIENIPSFFDITQLKGAIVCGTQIVKGIGRILSMHCPDIPGVTGELDTNLSAKLQYCIDIAENYDYILLHINGTDEAAHMLNTDLKMEFLKKIDTEIIKKLKIFKDVEILITADHETSSKTGKHIFSPVNLYTNQI